MAPDNHLCRSYTPPPLPPAPSIKILAVHHYLQRNGMKHIALYCLELSLNYRTTAGLKHLLTLKSINVTVVVKTTQFKQWSKAPIANIQS